MINEENACFRRIDFAKLYETKMKFGKSTEEGQRLVFRAGEN